MHLKNFHIIRRCQWLVKEVRCGCLEMLGLSGIVQRAALYKVQYGRIKVCLMNLGKNDAQDWLIRQKEVADIAVRAMGSSALGTWERKRFGKIRLIIFVRGKPRYIIVTRKVLFFIEPPPSDDLGECVRYILSNVIWFSKGKENYYGKFFSKEVSKESATEYTRQSQREIDLAISCAIQEKKSENKEQESENGDA